VQARSLTVTIVALWIWTCSATMGCGDTKQDRGEASGDAGLGSLAEGGGAGGAVHAADPCAAAVDEVCGVCDYRAWAFEGAAGDTGVLRSDCALPFEGMFSENLEFIGVSVMLDCVLLNQTVNDPHGWDYLDPESAAGIRFGEAVCADIRAGVPDLLYVLAICGGCGAVGP